MATVVHQSYRDSHPPNIETSFYFEHSNSSPRSGDPVAYNQELRARLSSLLDEIDLRCRRTGPRNFRAPSEDFPNPTSHLATRKDLEVLYATIAKRRKELEKARQTSSLRLIEDQIKLKRKQLSEVQKNLESLSAFAGKQVETLSRSRTSPIIRDLEEEIGKQKRMHLELRKTNFELEQQLKAKHRSTQRSAPTTGRSGESGVLNELQE